METSLYLAKVIGLYLLVIGLHMLVRRKEIGLLIEELVENRPLIYITSIFALILGLLLVVSHNVWVAGWPLIITLLSWMVLIKAIVYLVTPFDVLARLVAWANRPAWFTLGGPLWAALGLFLAAKGFQVI